MKVDKVTLILLPCARGKLSRITIARVLTWTSQNQDVANYIDTFFYLKKKYPKKADFCKGASARAQASAKKILLPHPFLQYIFPLAYSWNLTFLTFLL